MKQLISLYQRFKNFLQSDFVFGFIALVTRVGLGSLFLETGTGKLRNIQRTIDYFRSLQIPFAEIQAPFVGFTEAVCGLMLILGLGGRIASIPLFIIMCVATRTAEWDEVTTFTSLFRVSDFLTALIFLWIIIYGSGVLSLDFWISKKIKKGKK